MSAGKPRWDIDGAAWPHREASEFVTAGGVEWHVQRYGKGPEILFLHGTGAATHSWAELGDALKDDFTIIAVDLPGHGFTSTPKAAGMSLPGMAQSAAALLKAIGAKPDIIVGHSAGAAIMVEMLAEGLIKPRAALSINGAFAPFGGPAAFLFPAMAKMLSINPFIPLILAQGAARKDRVGALIEGTGSKISETMLASYATLFRRPGHVAGALKMMANWKVDGLRAKLSTIKTPIVFAAGECDRAVPPWLAKEAARLTPKGSFRLIPSLGHLAHEEDPTIFAALIRNIAALR